jgi:prepilin-type N-terminal cleavage/methylation domain-containing protein
MTVTRHPQATRSPRGYTVIEVTMALAILAIGASGILALQKVTLAGVTGGRNIATANEVAVAWTERLRADAAAWNNPVTGSDITDTMWLDQATDPPGGWIVPSSVSPNGSAWADIEGNDIYPGAGGQGAYCTHLRLTRQYGSLIRAEVRVFWKRNGTTAICDDAPADITGDVATYGFVHIVTGVFNTVNPT